MDSNQLLSYFADRGAYRIAGGCFGTVFGLPDKPGWIIKKARNDGTRTYLEWVLWRTSIGQRMKGMPEIDFFHSMSCTDDYIVGMKKYRELSGKHKEGPEAWAHFFGSTKRERMPEYLRKLVEAFEAETHLPANDIHSGNFMQDGSTVILTDPSSSAYQPLGTFAPAMFQELNL